MKTLIIGLALLTLASPASPQMAELWFTTEAPEFKEPAKLSERVSPLLDRAAYDRFSALHLSDPAFVLIREVPSLSPRARYGINFIVPRQNRGYIVDGDATSGYVLYADLNGNGTVVDDTPIRLSRVGDFFTTLVTASVNRDGARSSANTVMQVRFVAGPVTTAAGDSIGGAAY